MNYSFWQCFLWGRLSPLHLLHSPEEKRKTQIHFYRKYNNFQTKSWYFSSGLLKKICVFHLVKRRDLPPHSLLDFCTAILITAVSCSGCTERHRKEVQRSCPRGSGRPEAASEEQVPGENPSAPVQESEGHLGSQHSSAGNQKYLLRHQQQAGREPDNTWCCA